MFTNHLHISAKRASSGLRILLCNSIGAINALIPKKRQCLFHCLPDVDDQMVAVLRRIMSNGDRVYQNVFVSVGGDIAIAREALTSLLGSSAASKIKIVAKNSLTGLWAYWRSDHVFFTHGLYLSSWLPRNQCNINLWHGMPVKAIWNADKRSEFNTVQACTYMLCTSPRFCIVMHSLTGLPRSAMLATGLPRNDLLYSTTPAVMAFRAQNVAANGQLAICLPTFRQMKGQYTRSDGCESENVLMMSPNELDALQTLLAGARIKLLVKPHPLSIHYGTEQLLAPNIQVVSDSWFHAQGITLYEALGQADFLITDVSSVYIDYLCINRPVFFYFPDLAKYRETRGFVFEPVENWLPGRLCTTVEQLLAELTDHIAGRDPHRFTRIRLAAELNPQTAPIATSRLLALLDFPTAVTIEERQ